jgi:hypothetical protein
MEDLIMNRCTDKVTARQLINIYKGLKHFEKIWFCRDARKTADYIIEWNTAFSVYILDYFCPSPVPSSMSRVQRDLDINKVTSLVTFYSFVESHSDSSILGKALRIPQQKSKECTFTDEEMEEMNKIRDKAIKTWETMVSSLLPFISEFWKAEPKYKELADKIKEMKGW